MKCYDCETEAEITHQCTDCGAWYCEICAETPTDPCECQPRTIKKMEDNYERTKGSTQRK